MDTNQIITQIDTKIARLQQVKGILSSSTSTKYKAKRGPYKARVVVAPVIARKRILSPEARARIAAAQKARWAKVRRTAKGA